MDRSSRSEFWRIPLRLTLAICLLLPAPALALDVAAARKPLDATFAENLAKLAETCDKLDLPAQAELTRKWIIPRDPRRQILFLPPESDTTRPAVGAPKVAFQWHDKFTLHRRAQAAGLFDLAKQAVNEGDTAVSWQLLNEVCREEPDHTAARQILAFPPSIAGVWKRTGWAAPRKSAAPHPMLGKVGIWKIETPRYSISTNHSDKEGAKLGAELEKLHDVWLQLFGRHWISPAELKERFAGKKPPAVAKSKRQVVLFKNRDEYLAALGPEVPHIMISKGVYSDARKTVYLYADEPHIRTTWYHEATHQLFSELGRVAPNVGAKQNAWIIEGIAMYLESLTTYDGYCTVGGFDAERLQDARYRRLVEGFHLPLSELAKMGFEELQKDKDVRKLYTESAGLAHFLMDGQQGKYRAALGDFVAAVYQGRDSTESLASLTQVKFPQLEADYQASLAVTDDDLAALRPAPHLIGLRLARTAITDNGLRHLVGHAELEWIDLSHTRTSDAGLAFLKDTTSLRQLMLDGTKVTKASLPAIGELRDLEELDLANLEITDDDLAHLSGLKKLKILYLTGTKVTDAGLAHLAGMKFEILDVEGTTVTPAAAKKLVAN